MQLYNPSQIFDTEDQEEYRYLMLEVFGRNIKNLRLKKKMTQEQVAERAGINHKYLGELERGEKCATALIVYKISKALGVSVCEILSTNDCRCIDENLLKEAERLFEGKKRKDIQKAIRILGVFFE